MQMVRDKLLDMGLSLIHISFQGKLYECNFIEIMECLKVLADDFMKPTINQTDVYKRQA